MSIFLAELITYSVTEDRTKLASENIFVVKISIYFFEFFRDYFFCSSMISN